MQIRHRRLEDRLWVEAIIDNRVIAWASFVLNEKKYLWSASTFVEPKYRRAKVAKQIYMYAHNLGYEIRPSGLQTDAGRLMWKSFKKQRLPFAKLNIFERIIYKVLG
jgi:hypothetical protein